ncbi:MAG: translation initiation factor IF-2 [Clostridiales bacterium]|jgi:translation initiation factor IF-2|nr:translation initiation factor IF-2 [Clostridiales bacterium]
MSDINVYVTTKKVKENAKDLLNKIRTLQQNMDEYLGLISKLENTLQQQIKEMEEKKKAEALKAAEKKRQAEKAKNAAIVTDEASAQPAAGKGAGKQHARDGGRKKGVKQSSRIIDDFLAQPPAYSQKEKKADSLKGEAHPKPFTDMQKGKEKRSKKDYWEDESPAIFNKLRKTKEKKSIKETQKEQQKPPERKKAITMGEFITVKELSEKIGIQVSEIIKRLMKLGVLATINQELDYDTAALVASEFDIELEKKAVKSFEEMLEQEDTEDSPEDLKPRPPVVTVMGHVDHGKTSLLDAIRNSRVTEQEAGGITQHIGAYMVEIDGKSITFIDTPGHEAFSSMRARGAKVTDIAVLVVAADDGVMPQTVEAINHAKEADVPIIVAINKIDIPGVNPDRIKQELAENGLLVEEWSGDTIAVPISALKKQGIDTLLEMILLVAEMQELKANPNRLAKGTIIEAKLDKGRGPVATVLVQNGTLNVGDPIVAGTASGRVRAMIDHNGRRVKSAGPSVPVEVLGFSEVPEAGDILQAVGDDKLARQVAEERKEKIRDISSRSTARASLDDLFNQIEQGELKELNIIIKADVQGTAEAVKQALERLSNDKVRVRVIHSGVGTINESDVILASASNAIIIGFNVRPPSNVVDLAEKEKIDIRLYRIIYNAIEDVEAAMKGMLEPTYREVVLGYAEVREIFRISGVGTVAGCYVTDGKITRNAQVRIVRDGIVVHEGRISSLKRFKDDVREVAMGYECGIAINNYNDVKEGDVIEAFIEEEIKNE